MALNTQLSVDCDPEMKKRINAIAKKHGVTKSEVVRLALSGDRLDVIEEKLEKSRAALAS